MDLIPQTSIVGARAFLNIGNYYFAYIKYIIPLSWTIIFDEIESVSVTTVKRAKERLRKFDINIEDVELLLGSLLGNENLSRNRKKYLTSMQSDYETIADYFSKEKQLKTLSDIRNQKTAREKLIEDLEQEPADLFDGSLDEFLDGGQSIFT